MQLRLNILASVIRLGAAFIRREDGQLAPFAFSGLLIAYALFMGSAIDMSNLWLHKENGSAAAQAACESGAADMLWVANQGTSQAVTNYEGAPTGFPLAVATGSGTYTTPPAGATLSGNCDSASQSVAMCAYARANGFDASTSEVSVTWTVSDVTPTPQVQNPNGSGGVPRLFPASSVPPVPLVTKNGVLPYLKVTVSEKVPTYLLSVLPWFHSPVTVSSTCNCGIAASDGPSVEQSLTGSCPASDTVYSSGEWEIDDQAPNQLRTINGDEPLNPVYYKCNDSWIDQSGTTQAWNYLSTLPDVTIDGIQIQVAAGNQDTNSASDGYARLEQIGLITSYFPFMSVTNTPQYAIGTELFPAANLPYAGEGQDTTNFSYGSSSYLWGSSSPALLKALANNRYFGFDVSIVGNKHRDFLGHGGTAAEPIPEITVFYHTGSDVVATF